MLPCVETRVIIGLEIAAEPASVCVMLPSVDSVNEAPACIGVAEALFSVIVPVVVPDMKTVASAPSANTSRLRLPVDPLLINTGLLAVPMLPEVTPEDKDIEAAESTPPRLSVMFPVLKLPSLLVSIVKLAIEPLAAATLP